MMTETDRNQERERRILDATAELILYYGFDKTTVSDIAKKAGISKGAIYLHFSSKESIVDALVLDQVRLYSERMLAAMENDEREWSFVTMYQSAMGILIDYPVLMALSRGDRHVFGSYAHKTTLDLMQFKRRSRYPMLKAMQEAGALRDDIDMRRVDHLLSLMTYGVVNSEEALGEDVSLLEIVEALGDMLEQWLIPPDGGNREAGRQIILGAMDQLRDQLDTLGSSTDD
jgi:TetR/AcrR family acrAB operon transcriptional repressor